MGIEMDIVKGLPSSSHQFDLLLPHIDLTKVPGKYQHYMERFPKVLNRRVVDISKRHISKNLVSKNSDYKGPVIVKTNANYGGLPETFNPGLVEKIYNRTYRFFKPGVVRKMKPSNYQVYNTIEDVPHPVWRNPNLVVERFMPEREDDYYCIRVCFFLGDVNKSCGF